MSHTYKLLVPIEFGERTIKELTLERPKGKHLRNLPQNPSMGHLLDLASKISGEAPPVIDELDGADAMAIVEIIGDFLESSPKTGGAA